MNQLLRTPGRLLTFLLFFASISAAQSAGEKIADLLPCDARGATAYYVSVKDRAQHIVRVTVAYKGEKGREFQLPVWNALYQVRDFAQYVRKVSARGPEGKIEVQKTDKTTWRVEPSTGCPNLEYEIYSNEPGPYGAQLNEDHAFFNWAEVLMYPTDARSGKFAVAVMDLPQDWQVRDGGLFVFGESDGGSNVARAQTYDQLVDSPVEMGKFATAEFQEGGGRYTVLVHADPADYDMNAVTGMLRRVVGTTVDWLGDRPFDQYTFIYHFPKGPGGGGMEHAYSTAIDLSAQRAESNPTALASVSAHEFFHLWNVKRIRPRSLEPIDYTKENYTRALWFSEGLTSTVSDHMLYRAGLIGEKQFLDGLAREIGMLNSRPARLNQSVEESSLDTWFDKYPYYRQPERSINYYNKGQIVGELLDLQMRALTNGKRSLRDLFQWMNREYAKKGLFFPDSDGVQLAAETLTGESLDEFFERYVAGTVEIPYDNFFAFVGLRPIARTTTIPAIGINAPRSFGPLPVVISVEPGSEAAKAGIIAGDVILTVDGVSPGPDLAAKLEGKKAGDTVKLKVRSRGKDREVGLRVATKTTTEYLLVDTEPVTAEQRTHRAAWLKFESEGTGSGD